MKMDNSYFQNKFIIIYPFIPLITKSGNKFAGFKFRALDIQHYIPRYTNTNKPQRKELRIFFDGLLRQIKTQNGEYLTGLGYSVHTFNGTLENKEKELNRVRNNIELLYFLFNQSNNNFGTSFPKFYVVDEINKHVDKDYLYSFRFIENLENSIHHFILSKKAFLKRPEIIPIRIKSNHYIQEPYINSHWEKRISKSFSECFYRGLFWANNVKDPEKRIIEKIISSTIAVETMVKIPKRRKKSKWSVTFAEQVMRQLKVEFPEVGQAYMDRMKSALEQAANVRSNIVHARDVYEIISTNEYPHKNSDTRINFDGNRYIFAHDLLYEIFDILVNKKISGDNTTAGIRFSNLIERIYPNKDIVNSTVCMIEKKDDFFKVLTNLNKMKTYDSNGIVSRKMGVIIKFINDNSKKLRKRTVPFELIPNLKKLNNDERGWKIISDINVPIEKWNRTTVFDAEKIKYYKAIDGLVDFLDFLSNYVLYRNIEINNKNRNKLSNNNK